MSEKIVQKRKTFAEIIYTIIIDFYLKNQQFLFTYNSKNHLKFVSKN